MYMYQREGSREITTTVFCKCKQITTTVFCKCKQISVHILFLYCINAQMYYKWTMHMYMYMFIKENS